MQSPNLQAKFYDEETQTSVETVKNIEQFMTRDEKNIQLTLVGSDAAIRVSIYKS